MLWFGLITQNTLLVPSNPIELDQVGCKYIPHVTGIMEGQELLIKNSDKTLHNIHSMSKVNSAFNFAMPAKSDPSTKKFGSKEDPFYIKCDVASMDENLGCCFRSSLLECNR